MAQDTVERVWLDVAGRRVALHVLELGLACCGIEVRAARRLVEQAGGVAPDPRPGDGAADVPELHVLVVAGTVTARLAPVLADALEQVPHPRSVLAFGACAATGGPYWDSYAVLPGAHEVVPVDAWVAGCPPRPADLIAGLEEVLGGRA
jgi:NADH-quinone oxidoreductase subunit B